MKAESIDTTAQENQNHHHSILYNFRAWLTSDPTNGRQALNWLPVRMRDFTQPNQMSFNNALLQMNNQEVREFLRQMTIVALIHAVTTTNNNNNY